jgi:hypothetical protein
MTTRPEPFDSRDRALLAGLFGVKLLIHLLTNQNYGFFRDELYFIACGEHLSLGYVDQPPLIGLVARFVHVVLGDSLFALRLLPALTGGGVVLLGALICRELGGGRRAMALTGLCTIAAPVFLAMHGYFSMNALDHLLWSAALLLLVRLVRREEPKLWIALGAVLGVAALNKVTIALLGVAIFAAVLATPNRRQLLTRWPWLGAAVALLLASPYLFWQAQHGWPSAEFFGHYNSGKTYPLTPVQFLTQQVLTAHPLSLPVWLAGLYSAIRSPRQHPVRLLGLVYAVVFAVALASHQKFYVVSPLYPALFGAGAVWLEARLTTPSRRKVGLGLACAILLGGVAFSPLSLPILAPAQLARFQVAVGLKDQVKMERRTEGDLPQYFADMFGWKELAAQISEIYWRLSPEERARAVILTGNYGEAGAIDFFGKGFGLPSARSGHNGYGMWGPGDEGEIAISVGVDPALLGEVWADTREVARTQCNHCMPDENDRPIHVSRQPKTPLREAWPRFEHYD